MNTQNTDKKTKTFREQFPGHDWPATAEKAAQPENRDDSGPTPDEYGDRWEPLRSKLTIREAQFLNTYTRTGDIAALNALVLRIIEQRDELLAACKAMIGVDNPRADKPD